MLRIARVLIEHPVHSLDTPFDYLINDDLDVKKGVRVEVSFNNQNIIGYVLDIYTLNMTMDEYIIENGFELKSIDKVIDDEALFNYESECIAEYMSKEYVAPLISSFQTMLPPSLKPETKKNVTNILKQKYIELVDFDTTLLKGKQIELFEYLNSKEDKGAFISEIPISNVISVCDALVKKGIAIKYDKEKYRNPFNEIVEHEEDKELTSEQNNVINEFLNTDYETYLLEGVTGSGKTEVYIRLAKYYLAKGKNVLLLVPEISLTPQMVRRFKSRIDEEIAIFHSSLSNGEKYDEYRRIARKEVRVVIGARSAIFAPLENLGIIIIDEEHSETYKQDNLPFYNAINIATFRARFNKAKLLLGSATPSLESKARARKDVYHELKLTKRISNFGLPKVMVVNMLNELRGGNYSIYSKVLIDSLKRTLLNKEQAILLLNKRGFSKQVMCKKCGSVFKCPNCDVSLTYHKFDNSLKCHYCGYNINYPKNCFECGSTYLRNMGTGTQKAEEDLLKLLPDAKIIRMDLDTVNVKNGHQKILDAFENKEYDILLGTQIIAKGLDFENVTLVGVINADIGLEVDFRSSERTFQLLTQVVGRSGRGTKQGVGIIQTNHPEHYAIKYSANSNYEGFFNEEMNYRKIRKYPPYRYLVSLLFSGKDLEKLSLFSENIKSKILDYNIKDLEVLGPATPFINKINNNYRIRLLVKFKNREASLEVIRKIKDYVKKNGSIRMEINVDPSKEG